MMINELPFAALSSIGIYILLYTAFCIMELIHTFHSAAAPIYRILHIILLILSTIILFIYENIICGISTYGADSFTADYVSATPAYILYIALSLLSAAGIILYVITRRKLRSRLSPFSLQDGLEQMPDGILFATTDGIPLLVNEKMQNISIQTFGTRILNINSIIRRLNNEDIEEGCLIHYKGHLRYLELPDGNVWDIRENAIKAADLDIYECIAYNITEQHCKNHEMEIRNAHLERINEQIRNYSSSLDSVIREQEILASKIRIHDKVGSCLLALRSYIAQNNSDREQLLSLWKPTVSLLKQETVYENTDDPLTALEKAARAIDIRLKITGSMPDDKNIKNIIMIAIHECLTNTVKHANGDYLKVNIQEHPVKYILNCLIINATMIIAVPPP